MFEQKRWTKGAIEKLDRRGMKPADKVLRGIDGLRTSELVVIGFGDR